MVAESIPARRSVIAFLICLFLAVGSLGIIAAPARAAVSTEDAVTVEVAPAVSAVLQPGQDLQLSTTVTNASAQTVPIGTVDVYLAPRALTTTAALDVWLRPDAAETGKPGDVIFSQPTNAEILPGNTETLVFSVPAASVGLTPQNAWGARGLAAVFTAGGADGAAKNVAAEGRSTFIWSLPTPVAPVGVTMVMPITTPPGTAGLIPRQALETYTGPTGLLTRQLEGVINRPVAIAIDPMILASIRILGTSAPASASSWLDRLAHAPNEIFPLSYADADIALQSQAGAPALLTPISFDHAIDPSLFATPTPTAGPPSDTPTPAQPGPRPAPTATEGPGVGVAPTTEELLAWDYTSTGIGWPVEGRVAADDLPAFAASGLSTTIIAGSQVTGENTDDVPNAAMRLGDSTGLVINDGISQALRRAAKATTDEAWRQAMAEASARLAVIAAHGSDVPRTLLAAFDRGWPPTASRLGQTIDAFSALPWKAPASLGQALASTPTANLAFQSKAETDARVDLASRLLQRESDIAAFASVVPEPTSLTAPHRLDLLAVLATAWAPQPDAWREAVSAQLAVSGDVLQSIAITTKGPINVVASQADIPLTLSNTLDQAVTVRIHLVPSNGRLVVGTDAEATIDAQSARTVLVPVSAKIGNGDVTLRASVYSPTGILVGQPGEIEVNVQAEWEGVGAVIFAILVVLFFGFGVWRNIVRRRKDRTEAGDAGQAAEAEDAKDFDTAEETHG
jgi:hypothetical protein